MHIILSSLHQAIYLKTNSHSLSPVLASFYLLPFCQFSHCFHYQQHFLSLAGILFISLNLICPSEYSSIVSFLINHSKMPLFHFNPTRFSVRILFIF